MTSQQIGLPDGSRATIRGGPTAAEAAAVLLALDEARRADERWRARRPRRSAWQVAARREAVGGRLIAGPAGLSGFPSR